MENQKNLEHIEQQVKDGLTAQYGKGMTGFKAFMKNVKKYGLATAIGATVASNAHSAVDVSSAVNTLVTDGTSAISAVGIGLITLAGVAVVFKWVKASFFG